MNALSYAAPSMQWVPPTLRTRRYWRTVGRFVLWGPLIGGAPYVSFIVSIPVAYAIGLGPALLAGLLFSAWWHAPSARSPGPWWRLAIGVLCGAAPAGVAMLMPGLGAAMPAVVALHGIPAAAILALTQRRTRAPAAPLR